MKIIKQFKFFGSFEKADVEDNESLQHIEAIIYCYASGQILLEADDEAIQSIIQKRFFEKAPKYQYRSTLTSEQQQSLNALCQSSSNTDTYIHPDAYTEKISDSAYEGKYKIKGKTQDGHSISAIVLEDTRKKPKLILNNLEIYKKSISVNTDIKNTKYGLTNVHLFNDIRVSFQNSQVNLSLISIQEENQNILEAELTAEMVLSGLTSREEYKSYSSWLILLLSFATGHKTNIIYELTTWKNDDQELEIELWLGCTPEAKQTELRIIQKPFLSSFFQQISSTLTSNIFVRDNLAQALAWYSEIFSSDIMIPTNFILLCTALETLLQGFKEAQSQVSSNRLISNKKYREIRDSVLDLLDRGKNDLNITDDTSEKYDIFCKKVKSTFQAGQLNRIGNLSETLQEMLIFHEVEHSDLFAKLDFVKIRNDLIHKGSYNDLESMFDVYCKLQNLFIRIVLNMLKYNGDHMERDGKKLICRRTLSTKTQRKAFKVLT